MQIKRTSECTCQPAGNFDKVLRTEQRHIEDNKLNSQKVAENNNSKNKIKDKQEAT